MLKGGSHHQRNEVVSNSKKHAKQPSSDLEKFSRLEDSSARLRTSLSRNRLGDSDFIDDPENHGCCNADENSSTVNLRKTTQRTQGPLQERSRNRLPKHTPLNQTSPKNPTHHLLTRPGKPKSKAGYFQIHPPSSHRPSP